MPVIGYLAGASPNAYSPYTAVFLQGLKESGYVEGQNVAIEYRWAENHYDRLPALAADLVRREVAVIATFDHRFVTCGEGGNGDDSDSVRDGRGPGQDRACHQSRATRW